MDDSLDTKLVAQMISEKRITSFLPPTSKLIPPATTDSSVNRDSNAKNQPKTVYPNLHICNIKRH